MRHRRVEDRAISLTCVATSKPDERAQSKCTKFALVPLKSDGTDTPQPGSAAKTIDVVTQSLGASKNKSLGASKNKS
jgi:hypothetical protein